MPAIQCVNIDFTQPMLNELDAIQVIIGDRLFWLY